jgi:hypothetical protein
MEGFFADQIEFEVPSYAGARRFATRLGLGWTTVLEPEHDTTLITVSLDARPVSLARVLRLAEEWVADEALGAIRFCVDDRWYLLEAGEVDWREALPAVIRPQGAET